MEARDPERLVVLLSDQIYPKPEGEFGNDLARGGSFAADLALGFHNFLCEIGRQRSALIPLFGLIAESQFVMKRVTHRDLYSLDNAIYSLR